VARGAWCEKGRCHVEGRPIRSHAVLETRRAFQLASRGSSHKRPRFDRSTFAGPWLMCHVESGLQETNQVVGEGEGGSSEVAANGKAERLHVGDGGSGKGTTVICGLRPRGHLKSTNKHMLQMHHFAVSASNTLECLDSDLRSKRLYYENNTNYRLVNIAQPTSAPTFPFLYKSALPMTLSRRNRVEPLAHATQRSTPWTRFGLRPEVVLFSTTAGGLRGGNPSKLAP
jgi:hypothetical protein